MEKDIPELIELINEQLKLCLNKPELYVCIDCGLLYQGSPEWEPIISDGDLRPFCLDCIKYCKYCDEQYASTMQYEHGDCKEFYRKQKKQKRDKKNERENNNNNNV